MTPLREVHDWIDKRCMPRFSWILSVLGWLFKFSIHEVPKALYGGVLVRWHSLGAIKIPKNLVGRLRIGYLCHPLWPPSCPVKFPRGAMLSFFAEPLPTRVNSEFTKAKFIYEAILVIETIVLEEVKGNFTDTGAWKERKLENLERKLIFGENILIFETTDFNETFFMKLLTEFR